MTYIRTNHALRAQIDLTITQKLLGEIDNAGAAQQMHRDGAPFHIALRVLTGRIETCN